MNASDNEHHEDREHREYDVLWRIDKECETPLDAALSAFADMQRPGTWATVFDVTDKKTGVTTRIDLLDSPELPDPRGALNAPYAVGSEVIYDGDLPCGNTPHTGTVTAVKPDASGDSIVTVKFDCWPSVTQDIPASDLR